MRAISSMATWQVLAELAEAAVAAGLPALEIESVGGVDAADRVASGEVVDLVFLASGALARLADAGHVDSATVVPIVLSQVAVAVPSGTEVPAARTDGRAFDSAEGVRRALRAASRIGYSTGPSGTALVKMIDGWGMMPEVGDRLVQARPGTPVATSIASGDVDLGFQQLSELVGQPGVRVLGLMPDDCTIDTVFSGAVARTANDAERAARVLSFLASPQAAPVKLQHAFEIPVITPRG